MIKRPLTQNSSDYLNSQILKGNLPENIFHSFQNDEIHSTKKHLSQGFQQVKKKENLLNTMTSFPQIIENTKYISNTTFNYQIKSPYSFKNDISGVLTDKPSQNSIFLSQIGSMSVFQKGWEIEDQLETLTTEEKEKFLTSISVVQEEKNKNFIQSELSNYINDLKNNKKKIETKSANETILKGSDLNKEIDGYWIQEQPNENEVSYKRVSFDLEKIEEKNSSNKTKENFSKDIKLSSLNKKNLEAIYKNEFHDYILRNQAYPDHEINKKEEIFQYTFSCFKNISTRHFFRNNSYKLQEKLLKINKGFDCIGRVESSIQENRHTPVIFIDEKKQLEAKSNEKFIKIEENKIDPAHEKWLDERRKSFELLQKFLSK